MGGVNVSVSVCTRAYTFVYGNTYTVCVCVCESGKEMSVPDSLSVCTHLFINNTGTPKFFFTTATLANGI